MNKQYTKPEHKYLTIIRNMSCIVCSAAGPSYAHHVKQDSAYYCVPLCYECHEGKGGIHKLKTMWNIFKMDEIDALALTIQKIREC